MIWSFFLVAISIAFTGANDLYPSCVFNPLCTCSKAIPNLGIVTCVDVPLSRLPPYLLSAKLNSLYIENNGLKSLEVGILNESGLNFLKISKNPLYRIDKYFFRGLDRSLRDLELSYLGLTEVPSLELHKLRSLNLAGNAISNVDENNWTKIRRTLETLILRDNAITRISRYAFQQFTELKVLDLSKNAISVIELDAFFPDTSKLLHLFLADNQLRFIPFIQMQHLKSLRTLDLDYNFIEKIGALAEWTAVTILKKFSLNILQLRYNNIKSVTTDDFQKFIAINRTCLDGNPIRTMPFDIFHKVQIRELSLSNCGLMELDIRTIRGLESHLQILDLSDNNLFALEANLLKHFRNLHELKLRGNQIDSMPVPEMDVINLLNLEFNGGSRINPQYFLQDIAKIKSLIRITVSNIKLYYLSSDNFYGFGPGVEELRLLNTNIKGINSHTFTHVRGIKKLDLSDNILHDINENALEEVGHSLQYLYLTNAFADSVTFFPYKFMQHLRSLRFLDLSFNKFEKLSADSFSELHDLEVIRLNDCRFTDLSKNTFQSEVHVQLKEITFSYNLLLKLNSKTFADLPALQYINFEDNLINAIETKAFINLNELRWLYLRGNKIQEIGPEAFSNLPKLELLDLAFNNLQNFDFASLDQVGSLTTLSLNLSYNSIHYLQTSSSEIELLEVIYDSNVKVFDVSHNVIIEIACGYFQPLESSLTHLFFSHNYLRNISQEIFGNLRQLQWLDLSNNMISHIESNIFRDLTKLQILNLSRNNLREISPDLFYGMRSLRIVDLSENQLKFMPELLFHDDLLESVSFAHNYLEKIPYKIFSLEAADSLQELDVSSNAIQFLHLSEFSRFKFLASLNLSRNKIIRVESWLFALPKLLYLDLSHNNQLQLILNSRSSTDVLQSSVLMWLGLKNISLIEIPNLPFPKLTNLHLSYNNISVITPNVFSNFTAGLQELDLSNNNLTTIPISLLSLQNLKKLSLSGNPIHSFSNNSLLNGFEGLRELDITCLPLEIFEAGTLSRLTSLHSIHLNIYPSVDNFNIANILEKNLGLRKLSVTVLSKVLNNEKMMGQLPKKLNDITIQGKELEFIDQKIFMGIQHPELSLTFRGTRISNLDINVFWSMQVVRNVTLDVRNNSMSRLLNPSTGKEIGLYNRTFLLNLYLFDNNWPCTCDIGWVEIWERTKRQLLCRDLDMLMSTINHDCYKIKDDLRSTRCSNTNTNNMLLDLMKTELECSWNKSSISQIGIKLILILLYILVIT